MLRLLYFNGKTEGQYLRVCISWYRLFFREILYIICTYNMTTATSDFDADQIGRYFARIELPTKFHRDQKPPSNLSFARLSMRIIS